MMPTNQALKQIDSYDIPNINNVAVPKFSPKLRKLAKYLIHKTDYTSIKDACINLGLNVNSMYSLISQWNRKSTIDYETYVNEQWIRGLKNSRLVLRNALINRAIDGTAADRKLAFQLSGDLVERQEIRQDIGLHFVFSGSQTPQDIIEIREKEKQPEKVDNALPKPQKFPKV
jgi:hypothetical protein